MCEPATVSYTQGISLDYDYLLSQVCSLIGAGVRSDTKTASAAVGGSNTPEGQRVATAWAGSIQFTIQKTFQSSQSPYGLCII